MRGNWSLQTAMYQYPSQAEARPPHDWSQDPGVTRLSFGDTPQPFDDRQLHSSGPPPLAQTFSTFHNHTGEVKPNTTSHAYRLPPCPIPADYFPGDLSAGLDHAFGVIPAYPVLPPVASLTLPQAGAGPSMLTTVTGLDAHPLPRSWTSHWAGPANSDRDLLHRLGQWRQPRSEWSELSEQGLRVGEQSPVGKLYTRKLRYLQPSVEQVSTTIPSAEEPASIKPLPKALSSLRTELRFRRPITQVSVSGRNYGAKTVFERLSVETGYGSPIILNSDGRIENGARLLRKRVDSAARPSIHISCQGSTCPGKTDGKSCTEEVFIAEPRFDRPRIISKLTCFCPEHTPDDFMLTVLCDVCLDGTNQEPLRASSRKYGKGGDGEEVKWAKCYDHNHKNRKLIEKRSARERTRRAGGEGGRRG